MQASAALAGCSSLVLIDQDIVGDAMERASLAALRWNLSSTGQQLSCSVHPGPNIRIEIHKRHNFNSTLKRMSTVVTIGNEAKVLAKGAPEAMRELFESVPVWYDIVHQRLARDGMRVLALGSKSITVPKPSLLKTATREDSECGLLFMGFACFDCPIKPDSNTTVTQLQESSHDVVMITGLCICCERES